MKLLRLIALILLACGTPAAWAAVEPSVLEVPLRIPLEGLYREAEKQVPQQAGHWRGWQRQFGIDTRYRAWRGPLAVDFSGEVLTVQAHVRYWVAARKRLPAGIELEADCGVDEPPRQAVIGLQVRFGWNPDWTLRPVFRLLPTRFLDRCEMTMADIDVTPLVGDAFAQQMRASLQQALSELAPDMRALQAQARNAWQGLGRALSLGGEAWLSLRPEAAALSPLYGADGHANLHLALLLRPAVILGERPAATETPLPPLSAVFPRSGGLRFELDLALDYAGLGQRLEAALGAREFKVKDPVLGIASVTLDGRDGDLYARLTLTGDAAGTAELWGSVAFDAATQSLRVKALDYVFDPKDPDVYALASLFYEPIREALVGAANDNLARETARFRAALVQGLQDVWPDAAAVESEPLRLQGLSLRFTPAGIRLSGSAAGAVTVRF